MLRAFHVRQPAAARYSLTVLFRLHTFLDRAMVKWCTSLVLTIVLAGAALAGVPLHSDEKTCPMMGTEDCCETAQSQSTAPQVYAARLCCSLNCSVPGTTGPTSTTPQAPSVSLALHHAPITPAASVMTTRGLFARSAPERNQHSPPFYIQHLALLI